MEWFKIFQRVYIRISDMYNEQMAALASLNLIELVREVAKVNPDGDIEPLYDETHGTIYERRTKKFIVRKVDRFIKGMQEIISQDENMATYASLKQLNRLIRAFDDKRKQISCYGLVYVYVIYTLLEGKSSAADDCANYLVVLHELVSNYFEDHPDDEIANFFDGCHEPIICAVKHKNVNLANTELPPRPRKRPNGTGE